MANRTQRVDGLGTHVYDYDNLYRITNPGYPGADETDYTYDAVGNRKTMVTGAGTTQYAYDAADRLNSVTPPGQSAISYTFDDNGNLTDRGSDDFVWDAEDRLTSATVNSVTTTFTYNGDGFRESLTVNSNTTTFTWDVNRAIPQVLDDEDLRYVYGLGRIAQVDGADTYYYLSDGLGSTMALTDEDGDVVNDYDYDVFGALRDSSGSQDNDFTFAGEQVDASTGLLYLRARYYDFELGRFFSRDPLRGSLLSPLSQNPYVYTSNSPVLVIDPLGLQTDGCGEGAYQDPSEGNCVPGSLGGRLRNIRSSPGSKLEFDNYQAKFKEHVNRRGEFRRPGGQLKYQDAYEYRQGARALAANDKAFRYTRADGRTVSYDFASNEYVVTEGKEIITYFQPTGGAGYVLREFVRTVLAFLP